ncbi:glycerophosphodiester phosphodiesterase [Arthrobacter sp. I2-34]|uniref:Glycerophosphodiester phosphodiesterase n=1 Tax=Arthrobacter hankyongi TaxID=2904801 RepID=A0ABS9LCU7_9MICC|nr:glycerophosphodiester phosphodiesterase family protein [Arthrobacter hankyongi]MCG2624277.1 glycerophosphodiester phosphodiesterase [Arthrobacter hankyongi]
MKHKVFAHRGASEQYAENTRAAFLQAIADGADGVECDIHLTKDLQLVCFHDFTLDRTSTGTGDLADHTLEELLRLDVSSWRGVRLPPEYGGSADQLVTLDELIRILRAAGRPMELALDLKHPSPFGGRLEAELLRYLEARGWDRRTSSLGSITISFMSFHPGAVKRLAAHVPAAHLCQLLDEVDAKNVASGLFLGSLAAGAVASVLRRALSEGEQLVEQHRVELAGPGIGYVRDNRRLVEHWLRSGLRLRVWTVDSPADVELCRRLGIQEITTNRPAQVRAQLEQAAAAGL